MAKLTGTVPFPEFDAKNWKACAQAQREVMDKLEVASRALPKGQVVGALMKFPAADGYAVYLVTRETKAGLEVMHVPYGDAWKAHPALIRGLNKRDVLALRDFESVFKHSAL